MTSSSEVMSLESSDKNTPPAVDKDKRFLIRQQLYYLFHAFRCTRLAYTTGQGDCHNQHCIMMRNVVKHITKCQSGKDCKFQHCPSSKEIIKHWKNCNDVECQVCAPLRRNNNVRKTMNNNKNNSNNNNANGISNYHDQFTCEKEINWRLKIQSIRPNFVLKLTDELIPVKVCEDVKNHSGYSDVSNYVKAFEFEIFQKADNINDYLYKLAEKFGMVYRLLLSKRNPKETEANLLLHNSNSFNNAANRQIDKFYQLIKCEFDKFYLAFNGNLKEPLDCGVALKKEHLLKEIVIKSEKTFDSYCSGSLGVGKPDSEIVDIKTELTTDTSSPIGAIDGVAMKSMMICASQTANDMKMSPDSTSMATATPSKEAASSNNSNSNININNHSNNSNSCHRKWSSQEVVDMFLQVHQALLADKDSEPFKQPVNWELLDIPDYPSIVKSPIDLATIKEKLIGGAYGSPWDVVDDFWLMFNNAWLYNKKTSKVYKMCSTLAKLFESKIDEIMVACGFCCGREFVYLPQVLICCTPNVCLIVRDAVYYAFQNDTSNGEKIISELTCDRYICCEKCYNDSCEEVQFINAENNGAACKVKKSLLSKCRNNVKENEEFVYCRICNRKWHKVCANHVDEIWREGFVCTTCIREKSIKVKQNIYKSKGLPHCELSKYIENRVNNYLKAIDPSINEVIVRVLSSSDKVVEVKPGMKSHYCETCEMPETFKYRLKAIFAFQEIDGQEVCFFGLHVQEYGSDCPDPNSRRVYLAYLDSVHYFKPRRYRTDVYHEFLVGYLDYAKKLGFTMAHIWACPPGEGDDYIFHMHPPEQKLPKPKRLQEWYIKMLDKAMKENVVIDYKDIFSDALHSSMLSPTELPYFEGDYWPNALEEIFKEIDEETNRRMKTYSENPNSQEGESSQIEVISKNNLSKMDKKPKKRKLKRINSLNNKWKRSNGSDTINDVSRKVLELMEKRKENFFVIRLHSQIDAANLPPINDPDSLFHSDLMDGRDKLLCLAREKHLEFSSLRRAKFSTLCFCYELHMEQKNSVLYACNVCNKQIEVRYTCKQCEDFELCPTCYSTESHPHPLFKVDPEEESTISNSHNLSQPTSELQDTTRARMVRYSKSLQHACQCRDVNCRINLCAKMKGMIKHLQCCNMPKNTCKMCQLFLRICFVHAKFCSDPKCQVPNCLALRFNWKQQGSQQRMQQAQMLRRRVALMQRGMHPETPVPVSVNLAPQTPAPNLNTQPPSIDNSTSSILPNKGMESNECDTNKKPNIIVPNNHPQVYTTQAETPYCSSNVSMYNSPNITYPVDKRPITDEDLRVVYQQYDLHSKNYPNKEDFQKYFGNWLNTNPKYQMAFDLLLKNLKRQNDTMNINTSYPNVNAMRDTQIPKNMCTNYSQPQWQSDNLSNCSYPQSFTYHNSENPNNIVYEYINSPIKPPRAMMNNPVYIASIPQNIPHSQPTVSNMHSDPMHHMNRIPPMPFRGNHSYLGNSPNYRNSFPNNGVQCLPQQHANMSRFQQSMMTNAKNAQLQPFRCLPQNFHDSNMPPNLGCSVNQNGAISQKHQQIPPSFPQYYNQNSQMEQQMSAMSSVPPLNNSPGTMPQNYGPLNSQVLMNSNINQSTILMHQGHQNI